MIKKILSLFPKFLFALLWVAVPFVYEMEGWDEYNVAIGSTCFSLVWLGANLCKRVNSICVSKIDLLLCLFLIYYAINGLLNSDRTSVLNFITFVALYAAVRFSCMQKIRPVLCMAIVTSGVVQSVLGIAQRLQLVASNHSEFPATGSFANPGPWGGFVCLCLLTALFCLVGSRQKKWRRIYFFACIPLFVGLVLSDSRAAWVAFFVTSVCFFLRKSSPKKIVVSVSVIVLAGSALLYLYRPSSADARVLIWRVCGQAFAGSPVTGVGTNALERMYMYKQADYLETASAEERQMAADNTIAYNEPLQVLCEQGVVGFLLLAVLAYYVMKQKYSLWGALLLAYTIFSVFSYPSDCLPIYLFLPVALAFVSGSAGCHTMPFKRCYKGLGFAVVIGVLTTLTVYGVARYRAKSILSDYFFDNDARSSRWLDENMDLYAADKRIIALCSDILLMKGEDDRALPFLEKGTEWEPSSSALCRLGECYQRSGKTDEAEQCFRMAERMTPGIMTPRFLLFCLYRESGKDALPPALRKRMYDEE
ncbi:MAG: O-antigen ligase family protein [Tannerellaceae bacterium]